MRVKLENIATSKSGLISEFYKLWQQPQNFGLKCSVLEIWWFWKELILELFYYMNECRVLSCQVHAGQVNIALITCKLCLDFFILVWFVRAIDTRASHWWGVWCGWVERKLCTLSSISTVHCFFYRFKIIMCSHFRQISIISPFIL